MLYHILSYTSISSLQPLLLPMDKHKKFACQYILLLPMLSLSNYWNSLQILEERQHWFNTLFLYANATFLFHLLFPMINYSKDSEKHDNNK